MTKKAIILSWRSWRTSTYLPKRDHKSLDVNEIRCWPLLCGYIETYLTPHVFWDLSCNYWWGSSLTSNQATEGKQLNWFSLSSCRSRSVWVFVVSETAIGNVIFKVRSSEKPRKGVVLLLPRCLLWKHSNPFQVCFEAYYISETEGLILPHACFDGWQTRLFSIYSLWS